MKGPKESTLQDLQTQNFSELQSQVKHVFTEADLRKHEKNTSIRAYFSNSFNSERGKRAQNDQLSEGQMGSEGSNDLRTGRQIQGLIHFSGPESIKHEIRMEPASSDPDTNQTVNISQQQESVNPEEDPGLSKSKTP